MASLHDDVTPPSSNFSEAVLLEDQTYFVSRKDAKSTHAWAEIALRRCARAGAPESLSRPLFGETDRRLLSDLPAHPRWNYPDSRCRTRDTGRRRCPLLFR